MILAFISKLVYNDSNINTCHPERSEAESKDLRTQTQHAADSAFGAGAMYTTLLPRSFDSLTLAQDDTQFYLTFKRCYPCSQKPNSKK